MFKKPNNYSECDSTAVAENIFYETMFVIIQGEQQKREVSHREEGGKLVPRLFDGEQCLHMLDGECHIIQAIWPHPDRICRTSLVGSFVDINSIDDGEL